MNILRAKTDCELFDYTFLMDCLSRYKSPRSKITQLLRSGEVIRVKKGIYVFAPELRRSMVNVEMLANQIYGPSYVSREYALAYYGLIPEHVFEVTCMTTKRKKLFQTPMGRFSYTPLPKHLFSIGFTLTQMSDKSSALIATPEKALADLFYVRKFQIDTLEELVDLLFMDLRLDPQGIKKFRIGVLSDILEAGGSPILVLLINWLRNERK
jgi:hypothetical protein